MKKLIFKDIISEDETELTFEGYFDNQRCDLRELSGPIARRRNSIALILNDIRDCRKFAVKLRDLQDTQFAQSFYISFVITYGKCYSKGVTRGLSLNVDKVFGKNDGRYREIHDRIIISRNKFVAHSDSELYQQGTVYLASHGDHKEILNPVLKFSTHLGEPINEWIELCEFVFGKVEIMLKEVDRRLINEHA